MSDLETALVHAEVAMSALAEIDPATLPEVADGGGGRLCLTHAKSEVGGLIWWIGRAREMPIVAAKGRKVKAR